MLVSFLQIVFLQLALTTALFVEPDIERQRSSRRLQQRTSRGFVIREANLHAPELYVNDLGFMATLVNLPGASNKKSYWELSYQLYFIPEDKYYEAAKRFPRGGSNPVPEQFDGKVLLTEGHQKKTHLATLKERTILIPKVAFKRKVPDAQRTKFATLLTAYSVKIFDAELNTSLYRTEIFLTHPYDDDPQNPKHPVPRTSIYLTFEVTPTGTLNLSQGPPRTGKTTWP